MDWPGARVEVCGDVQSHQDNPTAVLARYSRWKSAVLASIGVASGALAGTLAFADPDPHVLAVSVTGFVGMAGLAIGIARFFDSRPALVMDAAGIVVRGHCTRVPWSAIVRVRTIGRLGSSSALLTVEGAPQYVDLPDFFLYCIARRIWIAVATLGGTHLILPVSGLDQSPGRIIDEIRNRARLSTASEAPRPGAAG